MNTYIQKIRYYVKRLITSPTTVWFGSLYVTTLISMIGFNISRVGLNKDGLTGGPEYYTRLFLFYGLNGESTYKSPWLEGVGPWVIAPFLAIWMGVTLFFLKLGGFAQNGTTYVDQQGSFFYAFFNSNVYGFEINVFGENASPGSKLNLFYIGVVWLPIIAASIMTVIYKDRVDRESSLVSKFSISFVISVWLGIALAKMTDPNFIFDYSRKGLYATLFEHRKYNSFVVYKGEYAPLMLAVTFTFFSLIPILILGFFSSIESIYGRIILEVHLYKERRKMLANRKKDMEQQEITFEDGVNKIDGVIPTESLLNVENIYTYFRTESGVVKALDGVSFDIKYNESVGIVGESGCGKTVTAQSILAILPKNGETVEGKIIYRGYDLTKFNNKQMRKIRGKEIALLFQNPLSALNPVLSIRDQMVDVISLHLDVDEMEASKIAIEMMEKVGIPDAEKRIDEFPHQYSGGMRQRILIARALALRPNLLIADEPTTALDVTIQAQVLDIIKRMREEMGLSLMLITHNLGVVSENTDRLHIFYGGRVVESGPTLEIFKDPKHPYTIALLESIPSFGKSKAKGKLATIPGSVPQLINPPSGCRFHPRCKYATEICKTRPKLEEVEKGRFVACFHLDDVKR